mmetsp:Transcript_63878/g.118753  ORF Transcript_63878/g.118753 Transcript_63878/m.118753 type:complete len:296 (-) Transcript_63878:1308-2195(-)
MRDLIITAFVVIWRILQFFAKALRTLQNKSHQDIENNEVCNDGETHEEDRREASVRSSNERFRKDLPVVPNHEHKESYHAGREIIEVEWPILAVCIISPNECWIAFINVAPKNLHPNRGVGVVYQHQQHRHPPICRSQANQHLGDKVQGLKVTQDPQGSCDMQKDCNTYRSRVVALGHEIEDLDSAQTVNVEEVDAVKEHLREPEAMYAQNANLDGQLGNVHGGETRHHFVSGQKPLLHVAAWSKKEQSLHEGQDNPYKDDDVHDVIPWEDWFAAVYSEAGLLQPFPPSQEAGKK